MFVCIHLFVGPVVCFSPFLDEHALLLDISCCALLSDLVLSMGSVMACSQFERFTNLPFGASPMRIILIHKGGQPDLHVCVSPPMFLDDSFQRFGRGVADSLLPIREIRLPHVWGQSFRRASCGM